MLSNEIGVLFCIALLVLWFGVRREDRLVRERACRHDWRLESLYNEGRVWYRRCVRCDKQIPVPGTDDLRPRALSRQRRRHDGPGSRR